MNRTLTWILTFGLVSACGGSSNETIDSNMEALESEPMIIWQSGQIVDLIQATFVIDSNWEPSMEPTMSVNVDPDWQPGQSVSGQILSDLPFDGSKLEDVNCGYETGTCPTIAISCENGVAQVRVALDYGSCGDGDSTEASGTVVYQRNGTGDWTVTFDDLTMATADEVDLPDSELYRRTVARGSLHLERSEETNAWNVYLGSSDGNALVTLLAETYTVSEGPALPEPADGTACTTPLSQCVSFVYEYATTTANFYTTSPLSVTAANVTSAPTVTIQGTVVSSGMRSLSQHAYEVNDAGQHVDRLGTPQDPPADAAVDAEFNEELIAVLVSAIDRPQVQQELEDALTEYLVATGDTDLSGTATFESLVWQQNANFCPDAGSLAAEHSEDAEEGDRDCGALTLTFDNNEVTGVYEVDSAECRAAAQASASLLETTCALLSAELSPQS